LRIGIVTPYDLADEGGVKRHVLHLAEGLRRAGDDVTVLGPVRAGARVDGVSGFGGVVDVPANGASNRMAVFTPPWTLRRFFGAHPFDVVHLHEPYVPLLNYYALWMTPAAAHVATFHMYAEVESPVLGCLRRRVARRVGPIDRGIAVSRPAAEFAARAWAGPLAVIPNGVPTAVFHPPAGTASAHGGATRLLFVGNWRDERKGLPALLEAHRRLRREGVPVTLDVVGGGPAAAPSHDGVTFHGVVPTEEELAARYRACDIFVSPATGQESFGIVLLEAMSAARPIVCSDIVGYREVVAPGGTRLVPPAHVEALTEAIRALAATPSEERRRMGAINRRRAEEFDWDLLTRRVRQEYEAAIAARRGSSRGGGARRHHAVASP
jgi:phosphatidylinositol alpha-mannosyltransferase